MSIETIVETLPGKTLEQRARMRANAERLARTGSAAQKKDAAALLEALETLTRSEDEARETMPLDERVVLAFTRRAATENEAGAIGALVKHPGSTSKELSAFCGWQGQYWNLVFGEMCKTRGADLGPGPASKTRKAEFYSGIVADYDEASGTFTLKPQAAEGFARLGFTPFATGSAS